MNFNKHERRTIRDAGNLSASVVIVLVVAVAVAVDVVVVAAAVVVDAVAVAVVASSSCCCGAGCCPLQQKTLINETNNTKSGKFAMKPCFAIQRMLNKLHHFMWQGVNCMVLHPSKCIYI